MSLFVLGAGGHAKVLISTLFAVGYSVEGILDDDPEKQDRNMLGVPVVGSIKEYEGEKINAVIGIGDNITRKKIVERMGDQMDYLSVVHPQSYVHSSVSIAEGSVVFAGAVIQPDTVIGKHAIINTGATIDHDCVLSNYVHTAPGVHLAGLVNLSEGVFMGIASSVIVNKTVGKWSTIGAGAVVINDIPSRVTVVGVPAKQINKPVEK